MTRFVEKGVKFINLQTTSIYEAPTAVIYRSQVTEDEDWYDILNWIKENRADIETLIALGDNFEKKILEK